MGDAAEEIIEDRGDELPEVEDRGDELPTDTESANDSGDADQQPDAGISDTAAESPEEQGATAEGETASGEGDVSKEPSSQGIPKARFDEVNSRRKEAEGRLRELETKIAVLQDRAERDKPKEPEPEPFDFDTKEQAYMDAVLDGDTALAKSIRAEIRNAERSEYMAEVAQYKEQMNTVADTAKAKTLEELNFERVANTLVSEYAELDQSGDKFDEGMLNDIVELKDAYMSSGMAPDKALEKAGNMVMRGVAKIGSEPVKPTEPKKTNVSKNLETVSKQPPLAQTGESNGTTSDFDVSKLTDAEWDALPESKRQELRGDFL